MITLRKYKVSGGETLIALIFLGISFMGFAGGYVAYVNNDLLPAVFLFASGIGLGIISILPLSGVLWIDNNNDLYLFPDRTKFIFKGDDA